MPIGMLKELEEKAGAATPPKPAKLTPAGMEVADQLIARLRRQIAAEAAAVALPIRPVDRAGTHRRRRTRAWR